MTTEELITYVDEMFTSMNDVPVSSVRLTKEMWFDIKRFLLDGKTK